MLGYGPISADPVSALLHTEGAAADTLVARVPLVAPTPRARQQGFVQVAQNLLLTTLAVATVTAPFVPDEFPNPVRKPVHVQQTVHQNLLTTTLAQQAQAPFSIEDFTVTAARRAPQQPTVTPNLSLTTLAPTAGTPASETDWPNPVLPKRVQQPEIQTGLLQTALYTDPPTLLARVPLVSAAVKRALVQQPEIPDSLLTTTLATQAPAGTPFKPFDWQNPRVAARPVQPEQRQVQPGSLLAPFKVAPSATSVAKQAAQQPHQAANLSVTTLAPAPAVAPFKPFDWQNPARRAGTLDAHSIVTTSYYEEVVSSGTPIVPLHFDNPVVAKRVQQPDIPRPLLQTTLYSPPAVPLVRQSDWTNPVRPVQVQQPDVPPALLQSSLYTDPPTLVERVPLVAQAVRRAITQQPEQQPSLLTTTLAATGPVQAPFRQSDWQNPVRRIAGMEQHSSVTTSYYEESGTPFAQLDWQNPRLPKRVQQPEHQVGALQTHRFVPPQPLPFNKSDWLNPQPIKPVPQLWNTSQGQNPEFIPPPVVVVVPPPVGGDDKPEAERHRGWDKKRATLKRNEELRLAEDITALYRKLTGNEATAERAKALVQPISPAADLALAESRTFARQALQAQAQAVEIEIALRLLAAELQAMLDEEDELAIAMILAAL